MNYYDILKLEKSATQAEIKKAYRSLSMEFHPDKNHSPDAEMDFHKINEAYKVLSDPYKRKLYDDNGTLFRDMLSLKKQFKVRYMDALQKSVMITGSIIDFIIRDAQENIYINKDELRKAASTRDLFLNQSSKYTSSNEHFIDLSEIEEDIKSGYEKFKDLIESKNKFEKDMIDYANNYHLKIVEPEYKLA